MNRFRNWMATTEGEAVTAAVVFVGIVVIAVLALVMILIMD